MTDLATLEAVRETAWRAYDAIARDLPDCEHNREWKAQIDQARETHLTALRELERALAAQGTAATEAQPEPPPPSLPDDTSQQEPLPGLEAA